jgi:hypothetical protein
LQLSYFISIANASITQNRQTLILFASMCLDIVVDSKMT